MDFLINLLLKLLVLLLNLQFSGKIIYVHKIIDYQYLYAELCVMVY